jgi:hypothetical protein
MGPLQIQLLAEAMRGVCPCCGADLGLREVREGEKIPVTTVGPAGFFVCGDCVGKPIRLPDGSILSAT